MYLIVVYLLYSEIMDKEIMRECKLRYALLQVSKMNSIDVGRSSIQTYTAHKQKGTIAATTLVSKVHKQKHITSISQAFSSSVAALHV